MRVQEIRSLRPTLLVLTVVTIAPIDAMAQMTAAEIAKRAIPAVVFIKGVTVDGNEKTGSGFIVDPSGTIITNLHVIQGLKAVAVKLGSGDIYDKVQVKAFDERKDLAVIQIPGFGLPVLELGTAEDLQAGALVTLVGNPLGLEGSVSTGVVSGIRNDGGFRVIQTDAAANPGNSGGPLLDGQGRVVGVLSFKLRGAESLNFCVAVNYARGMLATTTASFPFDELAQQLGKTTDLFSAKKEAAFPVRWKSLASGTTKILRVDGDNLYVETVVSEEERRAGGFNTAELRKTGDAYSGQGRMSGTCSYIGFTAFVGKHEKFNRCMFEGPLEIRLLTPTRIEGRAMGYPPNTKFDCGKCEYKGAKTWQSFTWIPE